jgi:peptidylprolyl isomerase
MVLDGDFQTAMISPAKSRLAQSSSSEDNATMAKAKDGDKVKVHYTGTLGDGTVFDSSIGKDTLEFTIGECEVIPGFEDAVIGMEPGNSKDIVIAAEDAYGPKRDELIMEVEREQFPADLDPQVGMNLELRRDDSRTMFVTVAAVSADMITLDANHPLAGKHLNFNIQLVEIA